MGEIFGRLEKLLYLCTQENKINNINITTIKKVLSYESK